MIDELATLLLTNGTHERARTALDRTVDSGAITVLGETDERFAETRTAFEQYDDHAISFTDRMNAVQMRERDVDHVFAYDGDFETLGFERIPRA